MRESIETLMSASVRALDERRLDDWADCFATEAAYMVIPRANVERKLPLCLMADETKARIKDRVLFVREIWKENFTDYIPRHLYTIVATSDSAGEISTISNLAVYATEPDGHTLLLAVGEYRDVMVRENGHLLLRRRQVVIDTEILPRYVVYPL